MGAKESWGVKWGRGKGKEAIESIALSFLQTFAQKQQTAYGLSSADLDKGFDNGEEDGFTYALLLFDLFLTQAVYLSNCTPLKAIVLVLPFGPLYHRGVLGCLLLSSHQPHFHRPGESKRHCQENGACHVLSHRDDQSRKEESCYLLSTNCIHRSAWHLLHR